MLRHFMTIVGCLSALSASPRLFAEDVCIRRPDLCDDNAPPPPRPARRRPAARPAATPPVGESCRQPGASYTLDNSSLPLCKTTVPPKEKIVIQTPAPQPPAVVVPPKSPPPIQANTPMPMTAPTPAPITKLPPKLVATPPPVSKPVASTLRPAPRAPASATAPIVRRQPASLNFNSYMNANAAQPALSNKKSLPQEAFKDYSKPAVISGSSPDLAMPGETPANPTAGVNPAAGSGTPTQPAGGMGSSNSYAPAPVAAPAATTPTGSTDSMGSAPPR